MFIFLKLFFCVLIFTVGSITHADIYISEIFPNTINDAELEYITLKNSGEEDVDLGGYILADKNKEYKISQDLFVGAGEELIFPRSQTKLILNNSNETLYIYDENRELIYEQSYESSTKGEIIYFTQIQQEGNDDSVEEDRENAEVLIDEISEQDTDADKLEILFELQRPSYITQSGSTDVYICDSGQDECKVNFNIEGSFTDNFKKGDYFCLIGFGGIGESEKDKCNPNTVIFPEGKSVVRFQIFYEDSGVIAADKSIEIIFDRSLPSLEEQSKQGTSAKLSLRKPKIIVQSGLTGMGTNFYCEKQPCKFNLNYEKIHDGESCFWDFGPGTSTSMTTRERCNPGYVDIPEGQFVLYLRVFEKDFPSNQKTTAFYIHNIPVEPEIIEITEGISEQEEIIQEIGEDIQIQEEQENKEITAEILLQGKMGKEKTLSGSSLVCSDVESCYVNFSGEGFNYSSDLEYQWMNNGVNFSTAINPKGLWLDQGEYDIDFEVYHSGALLASSTFNVYIIGKQEKEDTGEKISSDLSEPILFVDDRSGEPDDVLAKGAFTQNFLVLKYDGLRISGKAPAASKVELYMGEEKILEGMSDDAGKYRLVTKKLGVGEYVMDTKIILQGGQEYFIEGEKKAVLESSDVSYWFIVKSSQSSKTSGSSSQQHQFILKENTQVEKNIEENLSIGMKVFMGILILLSAMMGMLHVLYISVTRASQSVMMIYSLRFNTKQKVCLIL